MSDWCILKDQSRRECGPLAVCMWVCVSIQIHLTVHLILREPVIPMPPVLQFHLTCAQLRGIEVTRAFAIKDSPEMALIAQVS